MAAPQQMLLAGGGGPDPYFANVELLLHCEGTNGGTTTSDSSSRAHTLTAVGTATVSSNQAKAGSTSLWLQTGSVSNHWETDALAAMAGDFTIEAYIYPTSLLSYREVLYINGWEIYNEVGIGNNFYLYKGGANRITGAPWTVNTWQHIALTRQGSTVRLWLNGVQEGSDYTDSSTIAASKLYIGELGASGGSNYLGYVDEIRVTKDVCRYTGTFTPPSTPFPNY